MSEHTPGPWHPNWTRFNGRIVGFHITDSKYGTLRSICEADDTTGEMSADEIEANGLLISSAPETAEECDKLREINAELLEVLIELADAMRTASEGGGVDFYAYANYANDVIDKVKGYTEQKENQQ